jgi:hypothetical protein
MIGLEDVELTFAGTYKELFAYVYKLFEILRGIR